MKQIKSCFFKKAITIAKLLSCICIMLCKAQSIPNKSSTKLELPVTSFEIKFQWQGDSIHSQWEPYAALLLPVQLPSCSQQFYMQFDLGSPYSLLYRDKVEEIRLKYPKTIQLSDSSAALKNFAFKVDKIPVFAKEIVVKQFVSPTIIGSAEGSMEVIGTIGADFIEERVILIDYPGGKILIESVSPSKLKQNVELIDFVYVGRRILLPVSIKGRKTLLFFDTGSSAYELITDKKTYESLSLPNSTPLQYKVKSWDKVLTAHTSPSMDSIEIALQKIAINKVTYIEGASNAQVEQMMKMGIGGMTGNKLFINYSLLLDTKNKKFSVLNSLQRK